MKFLLEMDHARTGPCLNVADTCAFVVQVIFPSPNLAGGLLTQGFIPAGGPVAGSMALRFAVEVESAQHLNELVSSSTLWSVASIRVTPLIELIGRRAHVGALRQRSTVRPFDGSVQRL